MTMKKPPFQLLEINVISAQDLAPVSRKMSTYAVAWVHPERKLSTRVDTHSHTEPTWNDKFVFRVDDQFLNSDTSAVRIEIYALRCFRDVCVGRIGVLVGNLIPPSSRISGSTQFHAGMRFVALQVRRPSGRPQGILNIGVAVLDSSMRSMPLYTHIADSAVGYRDLMGEKAHNPNHHHHQPRNIKLRRSKSQTSEAMKINDVSSQIASSIVIVSEAGAGVGGGVVSPIKLIPATPKNGSVYTESEVGPSVSVVAAGDKFLPTEVGSSVLEDWSLDEGGVEGLRSKLEKWRTELPPIYDNGSRSSYGTRPRRHPRRHTEGDLGGLFSCFGSSFGCECAIFCGSRPRKKTRAIDHKFQVSPSDTLVLPKHPRIL